MTRRRLPDRRPSATQAIRWAGSDDQATTYTVTVGFHLEGTPASVIGAVVEVLAEGFATKPHAEIEVPSSLYEQSERAGP